MCARERRRRQLPDEMDTAPRRHAKVTGAADSPSLSACCSFCGYLLKDRERARHSANYAWRPDRERAHAPCALAPKRLRPSISWGWFDVRTVLLRTGSRAVQQHACGPTALNWHRRLWLVIMERVRGSLSILYVLHNWTRHSLKWNSTSSSDPKNKRRTKKKIRFFVGHREVRNYR